MASWGWPVARVSLHNAAARQVATFTVAAYFLGAFAALIREQQPATHWLLLGALYVLLAARLISTSREVRAQLTHRATMVCAAERAPRQAGRYSVARPDRDGPGGRHL